MGLGNGRNLSGQLFAHMFICAKVKYPINGCDFKGSNQLIENHGGRLLTQIQSDLFIPAVDSKKWQSSSVNHVADDKQMKDRLYEIPYITCVNSRDYSKATSSSPDFRV